MLKTKREVVSSPNAPKAIGPYSQAIKTDNFVFVSGQIALKPTGEFDTSSIEAETKQVMENIHAIIKASGTTMDQVVKSTIYSTNLKNYSKINEVYGSYFPKDPPARETVEVKSLPKGAHVEISVIAVK
ncbi:MAG: Rid family detoxifying hydrolase [Flavobacteriales bacterium]|nr:Rid family detoxifying hydrolase [Flavobacteriales bacterium]